MCGYTAEGCLHALRLILSGLFDEYPNLKIILGHLGETIPYLMWRIDNMWRTLPEAKRLKRLPSEYFRDNFYVSTSGMFWTPAFLCAYLALGAERMLFAVDYPMESNRVAAQFMDSVPISTADKEGSVRQMPSAFLR